MNNAELGPAVSVVKLSDNLLEFFKSNTRETVKLSVEDDRILNIVDSLDGQTTVAELAANNDTNIEDVKGLLEFLSRRGVLNNVKDTNLFEKYDEFRRVINFLNDFSDSGDSLQEMWHNIRNARVMVIGLGAVGSWVVENLVQSGVKKFVLIDPDVVEMSNLHRQTGYYENEVGLSKIDALEMRINDFADDVEFIKAKEMLRDGVLEEFDEIDIDLIVNCADFPNVDTTSMIVGEYGLKRNIPHIVGGGYNLHLSLVGQTVVPFQSACVKCFQRQLESENVIDTNRVKKLQVKNRKVGSFGPMCSIIASFVGMESIKVLTKRIRPANLNRRGEFSIFSMDVTYSDFVKDSECEWCGINGKYSN